MAATFGNPVSFSFHLAKRKGKNVLEVYGDDVPDEFRRLVEMINSQ